MSGITTSTDLLRVSSNTDASANANRIQPAVAYVASLRTTVSRRGQISALNKVAEVIMGSRARSLDRHQRAILWQRVDWTTLSAQSVRAIMAKVDGAPATRNKVLCALRGVARMAWESNLLDVETYQRIKEVKGDIGMRMPKGRDVPGDEITRLLEACARDRSPLGARDAAIIALLTATGLRRAEVCALQLAGLDLMEGMVRVIGKRNKERSTYIETGAVEALRDWLKLRRDSPGPVFCSISKKGVLRLGRALSTVSVNRILARRAIEAGVKDITPHDFRRTFIGEMLDAGADVVTVAAIVGHEDVKTTQAYDRRGERAKQRAAALVKVPYKAKVSKDSEKIERR